MFRKIKLPVFISLTLFVALVATATPFAYAGGAGGGSGEGDGSTGGSEGGASEDPGVLRNVEFDSEKKGELPAGTITFDDPDEGAGRIYATLIRYVNVASIGVGVVAGFGAAIAGVQYASSKGDPGKTAAAVKRLTQVAIAIILYIFGIAIINWLVPGGVLNGAGGGGGGGGGGGPVVF